MVLKLKDRVIMERAETAAFGQKEIFLQIVLSVGTNKAF